MRRSCTRPEIYLCLKIIKFCDGLYTQRGGHKTYFLQWNLLLKLHRIRGNLCSDGLRLSVISPSIPKPSHEMYASKRFQTSPDDRRGQRAAASKHKRPYSALRASITLHRRPAAPLRRGPVSAWSSTAAARARRRLIMCTRAEPGSGRHCPAVRRLLTAAPRASRKQPVRDLRRQDAITKWASVLPRGHLRDRDSSQVTLRDRDQPGPPAACRPHADGPDPGQSATVTAAGSRRPGPGCRCIGPGPAGRRQPGTVTAPGRGPGH